MNFCVLTNMKLYLVRHTESVSNKSGITSDANSPLTENGVIQAHHLGQRLASQENFKTMYFSPYVRSKQTADIIASYFKGINLLETKLIIEKKDASSWKGKMRKDMPWDLIKKMRVNSDWKHEDGESFNDVKKRVIAFFTKLKKHENEINIIAITHNSFIKHLVSYVILGDKFIPEFFYPITDRLGTKNGGITILEKKQKHYETKPSWYLESWMA